VNCQGLVFEMLDAYATALSISDGDAPGERFLCVGWGDGLLHYFNSAGIFRDVTSERSYLAQPDESPTVSCGNIPSAISVYALSNGAPEHNPDFAGLVVPEALRRLNSQVHSVASMNLNGDLHVLLGRRINATEAFVLSPLPDNPDCHDFRSELIFVENWGEDAPGYVSGNVVLDVQTASIPEPVGGAIRRNLYLSTERNVLELWLESGPNPLRFPTPPSLTPPFPTNPHSPPRAARAAIRIAVAPDQGGSGVGARLVATTDKGRVGNTSGGVRVFDVSQPGAPTFDLGARRELSRQGLGYQLTLAPGLSSAATSGDVKRYAYAPFRAGSSSEPAGVRVWDLGSANAPVDPANAPQAPYGPDENQVCYAGVYSLPASSPIDVDGIAVWSDPSSSAHYVYALYGQSDGSGSVGPIGLLALSATLVSTSCASGPLGAGDVLDLSPSGPGSSISGTPTPGYYEVDDICDGCDPMLNVGFSYQYYPTCLTLDRANDRLYGAWIGELAMWDISNPAQPVLLAIRDMTAVAGAYGMTPWCTDIELGAVVAGVPHVYLALASDGLGVLDVSSATTFASGPLHVLTMPWQTTSIALDPTDPTASTLFVGSGSAGVDWVELQWP